MASNINLITLEMYEQLFCPCLLAIAFAIYILQTAIALLACIAGKINKWVLYIFLVLGAVRSLGTISQIEVTLAIILGYFE